MADISNELLYEVLKQLQAGQAQIKAQLDDHGHQLIRLREDVHGLRGDDLRRETLQVQTNMRLERIENRLDLRDA
jgi:hypothetical protein